DAQEIDRVPPVAGHQAQPAIAVVPPADADLLDAVPAALGEGQHLDVEHVAVDALAGEEILRHRRAEELEAALRVADVPQPDHQMRGEAEQPGPPPPIPGGR